MKEADTHLIFAPYHEENQELPYISGTANFPNSLRDINKYFVGINPKLKEGARYAHITMAHNKPLTKLMEEVAWWLKEQRARIWERPLQAESTTIKG
mmetsp:Transcript_17311/g.26466  ORF Transcript_17311/g.26466 Transcript_17311/m.26466 type:complete len:97 (+) Transcript_17311:1-291(+)